LAVVVLIPARLGSSRLPGKPLASIAGQTMIQRVFQRAVRAQGIDRVAVATDDAEIARLVESFGGQAVMTSPDHASGTDRLAEAARLLDLAGDDLVVNVQGDQPLCPPELIEEVVVPLKADPDLGMATLATPMSRTEAADPVNVCVVADGQNNALYFSRAVIPFVRDEGDVTTFLKHLGVYGYRVWFLELFSELRPGRLEQIEKLEQLRALEAGLRIKVVLTSHDSIEVDRPEDVRRVEKILAQEGAS